MRIPERHDVGIGAGRKDQIGAEACRRQSRSRHSPSARRRAARSPPAASSAMHVADREPGRVEIDQRAVLVEQYSLDDRPHPLPRAQCVDMAHKTSCRGVALGGILFALDDRQQAGRQFLAEFDAPLVEGVDAEQLRPRRRRDARRARSAGPASWDRAFVEDRQRRAVAGKDAMRGDLLDLVRPSCLWPVICAWPLPACGPSSAPPTGPGSWRAAGRGGGEAPARGRWRRR